MQLTATQKTILRFLAEEPAFFTPGCYRGTICQPERVGYQRRVWLPLRTYDLLIERGLTTPNAERRHAPNRQHPLVARLLEG